MAFIGVPLKTTLDVDFMKPLKPFVNSLPKLSKNQKTEAIGGLAELNKLRNRACMQKLDKSQSGLELLMSYFDQLCAIENKLPITPTKNQIAFTWKDSYKGALLSFNKGAITINDSAFERAAILFNIGAFMSLIAVSQKAVTEEELKTMMKLFQQAAGVFSKLKEYVPTLQLQHTLTVDLTPDSLSVLSMLMIAQAQETIYIKAVKDRMKPPALIKISAQCSDLYAETQKLMNQNSVKGIWEKEWTQAVASKLAAYAALAQYHQTQSLDVGEIGEKISRLSEANRLISSVNGFAAEKEVIKKDLQAASKDNDFIYHERVPEFKNLPTLDERAVLAKQTPINFPMSTNFKDIFETSLVPIPGENSSCNLM